MDLITPYYRSEQHYCFHGEDRNNNGVLSNQNIMSSAVHKFLKTYGTTGVGVYAGITVVSISSFFVALRNGGGEEVLLSPLEKIMGADSETIINIRKQLSDMNSMDERRNSDTTASGGDTINWVREGTLLGIATGLDSVVLPIKLALLIPLTKVILKRRGR